MSVNADEHVQVPVLPDAAKTIVPTLEQLVKPAAVHLLSVSVVEAVAAIVDSARELVQPDGMLYTSLESGRICAKICDTGNIPIQLNFMEARATVTPVMPPALPMVFVCAAVATTKASVAILAVLSAVVCVVAVVPFGSAGVPERFAAVVAAFAVHDVQVPVRLVIIPDAGVPSAGEERVGEVNVLFVSVCASVVPTMMPDTGKVSPDIVVPAPSATG